ncbi:nucleotidyltransferase domain-containing protein [Pseudolabrys sp. FHR47]|uniref:GSU2403 family nucleotidyltransferase fold protein n=1 Tax=Pseudolabrys sp. FHR47 TaxID=2562284 RepID=UPI001FEECAF0|nr:nucleotidyltransferase domain-containing protein [Pseudolabrys sp. FHR47]
MRPLSAEQRRQSIDTQQVYEAWRAADHDRRRRFAGGMRWAARNGTDYLLRKIGKSETSLGPRDQKTEAAYDAFISGRDDNTRRLESLSARLNELAPVNVALGLGRVPLIVARILRACDARELLGEQILVVGTNAIYAYEAAAGVHIDSGLVATGDVDLLYDARRRLSIAVSDMSPDGLIGILKAVDESFTPTTKRSFRATNRNGYLVDLIAPEAKDPVRNASRGSLTDLPDDLEGAAIFGLAWLINSPKLDAVAIDERGYPVRLAVIDPRAFALHKAWLSDRDGRDPLKAPRDREQARAIATIATRYLKLSFDSHELDAIPKELRAFAAPLAAEVKDAEKISTKPDW